MNLKMAGKAVKVTERCLFLRKKGFFVTNAIHFFPYMRQNFFKIHSFQKAQKLLFYCKAIFILKQTLSKNIFTLLSLNFFVSNVVLDTQIFFSFFG